MYEVIEFDSWYPQKETTIYFPIKTVVRKY